MALKYLSPTAATFDYISAIAADDQTKQKLRGLCALTPSALLAKLQEDPLIGKRFLGDVEYSAVVTQLSGLTQSENKPRAPIPPAPLGVRFEGMDTSREASEVYRRRNTISEEITRLRKQSDPSQASRERLVNLEDELRSSFH